MEDERVRPFSFIFLLFDAQECIVSFLLPLLTTDVFGILLPEDLDSNMMHTSNNVDYSTFDCTYVSLSLLLIFSSPFYDDRVSRVFCRTLSSTMAHACSHWQKGPFFAMRPLSFLVLVLVSSPPNPNVRRRLLNPRVKL
ncbi:hypothetical protein C8F01DRAFT_1146672 [Mycena amicta]|nr:hypothetical protein C8F01DRAFT_1146672 [Mycena amicta]